MSCSVGLDDGGGGDVATDCCVMLGHLGSIAEAWALGALGERTCAISEQRAADVPSVLARTRIAGAVVWE